MADFGTTKTRFRRDSAAILVLGGPLLVNNLVLAGMSVANTVAAGRLGPEPLSGVAVGEQVVTSANFLIDAESNLKAALSGMGTADAKPQPKAKPVGHQAQGVLKAVNEDGSVSITHEPIASLKWPGMSMDFALTNPSLVTGIAPGSAISFEIVERGKGEWVITKLQAQHEGH